MPSFAPSTAARSHPTRWVLCISESGIIHSVLIDACSVSESVVRASHSRGLVSLNNPSRVYCKVRSVSIALILLGFVAFAYQGITYTTRENVIDLFSPIFPINISDLSYLEQTAICLFAILTLTLAVCLTAGGGDIVTCRVARLFQDHPGMDLVFWFSKFGGVLHLENPGAACVSDLCRVYARR